MKPKRKIIRDSSKLKEVTRVDTQTYYHPSSEEGKEAYMVFCDKNGRWLCDCMNFVLNIEDNGQTIECKHIIRIKKEFV